MNRNLRAICLSPHTPSSTPQPHVAKSVPRPKSSSSRTQNWASSTGTPCGRPCQRLSLGSEGLSRLFESEFTEGCSRETSIRLSTGMVSSVSISIPRTQVNNSLQRSGHCLEKRTCNLCDARCKWVPHKDIPRREFVLEHKVQQTSRSST